MHSSDPGCGHEYRTIMREQFLASFLTQYLVDFMDQHAVACIDIARCDSRAFLSRNLLIQFVALLLDPREFAPSFCRA
ncbi:hypothetical protein [Sphingobium sp. Leaf26]|uniref:hypothetical protein n=1 Tax=Sphingobium sp. Leaf26 TaxID=1735693 RepID=UPI00138F218C|nr:hypothetical protein [Sphingobium sp. Leaf26]